MGRRLEYEVKTSVRLNMSNPQHVKINDVIQNLDPKIFKSKNQFIIDAIQFYIDNYGKETFVIKKKEKERAEYIRSEDIDDIKEEVIEAATNEAKERFKDIFDKAEQIRGLDDAESCYQSGDTFFEDEHNAWERLNTELLAQGYSVEEVESLRKKYESKYAQDCKAERAVSKELNLGRSIWKELTVSASAEEKQYDKETIRDRKEQPVR